jgi:hypothetical protein
VEELGVLVPLLDSPDFPMLLPVSSMLLDGECKGITSGTLDGDLRHGHESVGLGRVQIWSHPIYSL